MARGIRNEDHQTCLPSAYQYTGKQRIGCRLLTPSEQEELPLEQGIGLGILFEQELSLLRAWQEYRRMCPRLGAGDDWHTAHWGPMLLLKGLACSNCWVHPGINLSGTEAHGSELAKCFSRSRNLLGAGLVGQEIASRSLRVADCRSSRCSLD